MSGRPSRLRRFLPGRFAAGLTLGLSAPFLLLAFAPSGADPGAGVLCRDRAEMLARVAAELGPTARGHGLSISGAAFELMIAPETRRWVLLRTSAGNVACLAGIGHGWAGDLVPLPSRPS